MDFKKKVIIVLSIIGVLSLLLLGVKYGDKKFNSDTVISNQQTQEDLLVHMNPGDRLIPCAAGGYDVYKPNKSLVVCDTALTPGIITYLDSLE